MIPIDEEQWKLYIDFVCERQMIWYRRQQGQSKPWTDNKILRDYSFTNVYRLLDPGTQFALKNITALEVDDTDANKLFNLLLYRVMGRESTFARILETEGCLLQFEEGGRNLRETLEEILGEIKTSGQPPFSKAYTVPGYDWAPGEDKVQKFAWQAGAWADQWHSIYADCVHASTPQNFYDALCQLQGVGNFIASQVYIDCTYWLDRKKTTLLGWSPEFYQKWMKAGPGALDGISRLTGKRLSVSQVQSRDTELLLELTNRVYEHFQLETGPEFYIPRWSDLYPNVVGADTIVESPLPSIMDIQNTCCEFSKYHKLVNKEGNKSRRKYVPREYDPREWSDNEFVSRASIAGEIRLTQTLEVPEGRYVTAYIGDDDVTRFVAKYSGYPLDSTAGGSILLTKLDEVKYPPRGGNSDPLTEISYHFNCGLGISSEITLVEK